MNVFVINDVKGIFVGRIQPHNGEALFPLSLEGSGRFCSAALFPEFGKKLLHGVFVARR
jgi:hypothetical protein